MKKRLWIVLSILLPVLLAGGLLVYFLTRAPAPETTRTVVLAAPVVSLDPAAARDAATDYALGYLYDGLVSLAPDGGVRPAIAESWNVPEPTVYEFTLRKSVRFHNGKKLTAGDVVFSFERILTPGALSGESSPRRGLLGPLVSVEAVDSRTVRFTLGEPWPLFLTALAGEAVVSKESAENADAGSAAQPVGAGPYAYAEGSPKEGRIVLKYYGGYYGESEEDPAGTLVLTTVPELSARITALSEQKADVICEVPASIAAQLAQNPGFTAETAAGTRVHTLEMNVNTAPFDDVRVRRAVCAAVDVGAIIKQQMYGYADAMAGPVPQSSYACDAELAPGGYDPVKAKKLLAEAGFPDGFAAELDTTEALRDVAGAAAAQLRAAGMDVTVRVWDWGELYPLLVRGERTFALTVTTVASPDPYELLDTKLRSGGSANFCGYSNAELDALLDRAKAETDAEKRTGLYREAQRIVLDDAPWALGYVPRQISVRVKAQ